MFPKNYMALNKVNCGAKTEEKGRDDTHYLFLKLPPKYPYLYRIEVT